MRYSSQQPLRGRAVEEPEPPTVAQPSDAGAPLVVRCFGGFHLEMPGRRLEWTTVRPRVRALLRFLAAHGGRPVHRETILTALWPELPVGSGIRNLHVGVSTLRAFLEPGVRRGESRFVRRDGESYLLDLPRSARCDVRSFENAVAAWRRNVGAGQRGVATAALREALAQYAGDLLPEDGPAEWVVADRDRYRTLAAEAAATLAAFELEAGDLAGAAAAARRGLEIDGFRDDAWRVLAEAHQRSGDTAAAARTRCAYDRVLRTLGVPESARAA
ncbi:BTAD domain-containing putative transcriptional regulator [Micromonospora sp. NPDC049903]|uniref:AfsR/SARP family transcriptional regulator n=1 Tax=Micromonospora sp. NPDC049903 TaxID=3364276 RepID=UPI0037A11A9A